MCVTTLPQSRGATHNVKEDSANDGRDSEADERARPYLGLEGTHNRGAVVTVAWLVAIDRGYVRDVVVVEGPRSHLRREDLRADIRRATTKR